MLNFNMAAAGSDLYAYGSSQNKLFEYLASGKPVISNARIGYDIIQKYHCGISENLSNDAAYAEALLSIFRLPPDEYEKMCYNARQAAFDFDFKKHTKTLINVFEETMRR